MLFRHPLEELALMMGEEEVASPDRHALVERRSSREAARLADVTLVSDERRIAGHGIEGAEVREQVVGRGDGEEVGRDEVRVESVLLEAATGLGERCLVEV